MQSAARIVRDYYKSDVENFLAQMRALTHIHGTGQEAILGQVEAHLGDSAKRAASLLVIADIPLKPQEAISLVRREGKRVRVRRRSFVAGTCSRGVIETLRDGRLVMHDAYRILAQKEQQALPPEVLLDAKKRLVLILMLGTALTDFAFSADCCPRSVKPKPSLMWRAVQVSIFMSSGCRKNSTPFFGRRSIHPTSLQVTNSGL